MTTVLLALITITHLQKSVEIIKKNKNMNIRILRLETYLQNPSMMFISRGPIQTIEFLYIAKKHSQNKITLS